MGKKALTIAEKILAAHVGRKAVEPGEFIWARVDFTLGNDVTAPIAIKQFRIIGKKKVFNRNKIALVLDHFVPNKDLNSARQSQLIRNFAREQKVRYFFDVGRMGIEHALLPEQGLVLPGQLVIGADSHTCTYGALGAFSPGVGSTDLAAAWATGYCWFKVPESVKFIYYGKLNKWVGGKDVILKTIGDIGVDGALYRVMEFTGETIARLPMDDRFTICNMAIEAGGKTGIIAPDKVTFDYVRKATRRKSIDAGRKARWRRLKSDRGAGYSAVHEYDVSKLEPVVALPHLPSKVKEVTGVGRITLDQVVIGSCTNGRISDLRAAAAILKGRKVKSTVRLIVIPATQNIYRQCVTEGLAETFVRAGGIFSTPSCGPCLGGHLGVLAENERALATTNRNFVGRMGHPKSEVYLANPAVAAASAVVGRIAHPGEVAG